MVMTTTTATTTTTTTTTTKEQIDFIERAAQFQVDLPAFFNARVGITSAVQWALTIQEGVNCIHHRGCHQLLRDPLEKR